MRADAVAETRRPLSPVALAALEKARQIVGYKENPVARRWAGATRTEKELILKIVGLPVSWWSMGWDSFSSNDQARIVQRCRDFEGWLAGFVGACNG